MGFTAGIIGLPNVGKSTIFNALCSAGAQMASYPFTTIEPNRGVVHVSDQRLRSIGEILRKPNPIPTSIEFTDVAGLVKGASAGEGLGNTFLGHIRNVDALVQIVRCFHSEDAQHVLGDVNPDRDVGIINTELILADLELLHRRCDSLEKQGKSGDREVRAHLDDVRAMIAHLDDEQPLRSMDLSEAMAAMTTEYGLITAKPVLYVANVDESGGDPALVEQVRGCAERDGAGHLLVVGELEEEISELPEEEKLEYLGAMGLQRSGLDLLIEASYGLLGLITFYTVTTDLQAWTLREGLHAAQAAGRIHTDFERGFIRAEIFSYDDLVAAGDEHGVRDQGHLRVEGRDYVVRDGDIIHFLFNV